MIFLESICKRFDKDLNQIVDFSTTANKRYKTYKIKKRTSGTRTIEQPSKELKLYQKLKNYQKTILFLRIFYYKNPIC